MSQLSRVIELIRLTGQAGFLLEGEKEPLVVLPLANYEQLTSADKTDLEQAEAWSKILQDQINDWQKQQPAEPAPVVKTKSEQPKQSTSTLPLQPIHQAKPDLAEVMEEEIAEEIDEYLPEPLDEQV